MIKCIGKDGVIHTCEPHESKTTCGKEIESKKVKPQDYLKRFSCWECTY
jgi:hypothetical protein